MQSCLREARLLEADRPQQFVEISVSSHRTLAVGGILRCPWNAPGTGFVGCAKRLPFALMYLALLSCV